MAVEGWSKARETIERTIRKGTSLGRQGTSRREVVEVDHSCSRHGGERGFEVRIGVNSAETVDIPWSMLETCYGELVSGGYDARTFRKHYAPQARVHPCHVHVVGMMLVRAGLATSDSRKQAGYTPTRSAATAAPSSHGGSVP